MAGAVIRDDGRVLVIKRRDNGHWEPPGGVLELGETFESGVIREVLEETGVQVEVERLSGVYKNLSRGIVALVYRCHPTSDWDAMPSAEAADVRWIDLAQVAQLMDPAYAVRLTDAFLSEAASRAHDGRHLSDRAPGTQGKPTE